METFWKHQEASFGDILEAGRPDEARWGLEGSRTILIGKTHAIVRVTTISLESGEPRTLKYCKNTYEMSVQNCPAARPPFDWPNSPPEPLQETCLGKYGIRELSQTKQCGRNEALRADSWKQVIVEAEEMESWKYDGMEL